MNKPILLFTTLSISIVVVPVNADYTGKPMTDKEIRELIIKGELNNFEKGFCYLKTPVIFEIPPAAPDNGSTTTTEKGSYSTGTFIPVYTYEATNQVTNKNAPVVAPDRIYKCQCPCPYSRNGKSEECGESSAYFQYPAQHKPKCYPEDIKDWEVNDFRNNKQISAP